MNLTEKIRMIEDLGNGIKLEMVLIQKGVFNMGSEMFITSLESPQHTVSVDSFFMGEVPVTQSQWKAIASRSDLKVARNLELDPSYFKGDTRPVEQVSWEDAMEFCARLSKLTGKEYRLPSESEWEYACRAGTTTPFYFGEDLTSELSIYANHYHSQKWQHPKGTTEVGSYPCNAFGLFDMHGNVLEWCLDNWHDDYRGAPCDGSAWLETESTTKVLRCCSWHKYSDAKVLRGGSWRNHLVICRSSARTWDWRQQSGRRAISGFRVVSSDLAAQLRYARA